MVAGSSGTTMLQGYVACQVSCVMCRPTHSRDVQVGSLTRQGLALQQVASTCSPRLRIDTLHLYEL